jgi:hypothetical protein
MTKTILLSAVAVAAALTTLPIASASAQYYNHTPRGGAWGDRDRDGIPNAFDRYNNNRGRHYGHGYGYGHGRGWGDRDHDGVPNRYDRAPNNPWRR